MSLEAFLGALGMGVIHKREITVGGKPAVIFVRELSGLEVEAILDRYRNEDGLVPKEANGHVRDAVVSASLCDEHGGRQLEVGEIGHLPARLLAAVVNVAMEVNGFGDDKSEATEKKD